MTCYQRHEWAPGVHQDIPHEHPEPVEGVIILTIPITDEELLALAHAGAGMRPPLWVFMALGAVDPPEPEDT